MPPGVAFTYAPGRGGQHAERILQGFGGVLQVDGYAGYNRLIAADRIGPGIQLAYCWAHARRKLIEITRTGPAPIAEEGAALIRDLYAIEAEIRGSNTDARLAARKDRSAPLLARIDVWLAHHRARASAKSPLGEALAYIACPRSAQAHRASPSASSLAIPFSLGEFEGGAVGATSLLISASAARSTCGLPVFIPVQTWTSTIQPGIETTTPDGPSTLTN